MPTSFLSRTLVVLAAGLLLSAGPLHAQTTDDLPRVTRAVAFVNARIVQAPGRVLERGTVIVRDGLITAVGPDVAVPYDAERIAADSLVVYAGFIDGLSHVGVPKPKEEARRPEVKNPGHPPADVAGLQPGRDVRSVLDPGDRSIETLRKIGFTAAHVVPRGGMWPGMGALILLAGDDAAAMTLAAETSLFAQFETSRGVYPSTPMGVLAVWRQYFREAARRQRQAEQYAANPSGLPRPTAGPVHDALYPVVSGKRPVFFNVEGAEGGLQAHRVLELQRTLGFRLALAGLHQGFAVVDALKAADVPLFLSLDLPKDPAEKKGDKKAKGDEVPTDTMGVGVDTTKAITPEAPGSFFVRDFRTTSYEDVDGEKKNLEARQAARRADYYGSPARLHEAGLRFGFSTLGAEPADVRANLRKMIANGLPADAALAALTTDGAALLGVSAQLGSVDPGKIANLVVTDGDYFDEKTAVRYVVVDGKPFKVDPPKKVGSSEDSLNTGVAGTWNFTVNTPDGDVTGMLDLSGSEDRLAGTISDDATGETAELDDARFDGDMLTFTFVNSLYGPIDAALTLDGNTLSGVLTLQNGDEVPISARRADPDRGRLGD